ncbi:MAG: EamA family transporter [Spirochaetota bacterium]
MGIILAGAAALLYGVADFSGGLATRRSRVHAVLFHSQLLGLALALVAAPFIAPLFTGGGATTRDVLWGMGAGASGAFGLAFLYRGLAAGVIAVVSPVAAVVGAGVPVAAGLLLGESPGVTGWAGIAVSLLAIMLLGWHRVSGTERARLRASLLHGLLAGLGFGGFFVLIARPGEQAGLWPLVGARLASIAMVAAFSLAAGRSMRVARDSAALLVVTGVFDMGANIAFVMASRIYLLSVVSVISSLYPAPTVVLGRVVLGERLTPARVAGLVSAVSGVALMSV